ncbi:MAG: hypothetical protein Q9198_004532 [Flavoplaca austrocitrina]
MKIPLALLKHRTYSLQIKAEVLFRLREFVESSITDIDSILSTSWPSDSELQLRVLQPAIENAAGLESRLREKIAEFPVWQQWVVPPQDLSDLLKALIEAQRVRNLFGKTKRMIETNRAHVARVKSELDIFRQHLSYIRYSKLSSISLTSILESSIDRLNLTSSDRISAYVETMKRSCKDDKAIPLELYSVCLIDRLRVSLSGIDSDSLGIDQRSWLIERQDAIDRYQVQMRTDNDTLRDLAEELCETHDF